jgi:hypothetical protein
LLNFSVGTCAKKNNTAQIPDTAAVTFGYGAKRIETELFFASQSKKSGSVKPDPQGFAKKNSKISSQ